MYDLDYYVSFYELNNKVCIHINLLYENFSTPVFIQDYSKTILSNLTEFKTVYKHIEKYFDATSIKMTKNDLHLFYNTFITLNIDLPSLAKVTVIDNRVEETSSELTPKEKLFLMYIHGKNDESKIAKYWYNDYTLDIDYSIKHLEKLGFITSKDYMFNIKKLTKAELAKVLIERNISYKDNKKEIISAILNHIDNESLKKIFSERAYKLTSLGEETNKMNEQLMEFHKSYYRYVNNLSIDEFYLLDKKFKDLEAKEVCKIMMVNKSKVEFSEIDWKMLFEENPTIEDEFNSILRKYSACGDVVVNDVSDEEFLKIINKNKDNDDEEFLNIVNKNKDNDDEEFLNIVNKDKNIEDLELEDIEYNYEEENYTHKESFSNLFLVGLLISSSISVLVIFILYNFVFI